MSWISVDDELPEPYTNVKLSYGLIGVRAAVCDEWVSAGWITKSGIWSIRKVMNVHKHSKPTHWQPLSENESTFGFVAGIINRTNI